MVDGPIITRIKRLSGVGVFPKFVCPQDAPDFKSHNLIYGFNGSGKTTLSRVLACLESGEIGETLPPDCKFEIELDNGIVISESENLDYLKGRALVFNTDFVERNLQWTEGKASPVFYIGEEEADLARKLQEAEKALTESKTVTDTRGTELNTENQLMGEFKTNHARLIAEQLNYGRKYNAANLGDDYAFSMFGEKYILTEEALAEKKKMFNQSEALPPIEAPKPWNFELNNWIKRTYTVLGQTIGSNIVDDLKKHTHMLPWVRAGLEYHGENKLTSCLFCANELTVARTNLLVDAVDSQVGKLVEALPSLKSEAQELLMSVSANTVIPAVQYISPNLRSEYEAASALLTEARKGVETVIYETIRQIKRRIENISRVEAAGESYVKFLKDNGEGKFKNALETVSNIFLLHNKEMQEFENTRSTAEKEIKSHYMASGEATYNQREKAVAIATEAKKLAEEDREKCEAAIVDLTAQLRKHGAAAATITTMMQNYLGHKELEIGVLDIGYEMQRHKRPLTGKLSEGEKTAIALCYFLCTLKAESRKVENLIIVIDDPISSLDSKAMNYALSMIQAATGGSGQAIFLTHNANCMLVVRKWLNARFPKTHSLFFLDVKITKDTNIRSSHICGMPKLLRAYDSEYHYLFKLVSDFTKQEDEHSDYFYMLPNAMRRVLEVFLAFRHPATVSIGIKLESVLKDCADFDQARVFALEKLIQLESHSDSLDDLLSISSMTIEETKSAADSLLLFMEVADAKHYGKLAQFCA